MTIEEMKAKRDALAIEIRTLVNEFELATGVAVTSIDPKRPGFIETYEGKVITLPVASVRIEVRF